MASKSAGFRYENELPAVESVAGYNGQALAFQDPATPTLVTITIVRLPSELREPDQIRIRGGALTTGPGRGVEIQSTLFESTGRGTVKARFFGAQSVGKKTLDLVFIKAGLEIQVLKFELEFFDAGTPTLLDGPSPSQAPMSGSHVVAVTIANFPVSDPSDLHFTYSSGGSTPTQHGGTVEISARQR